MEKVMPSRLSVLLSASILLLGFQGLRADERAEITLRCWGIPNTASTVDNLAMLRILDSFVKEYPHIRPISSTGLQLLHRSQDMVPLMQIAGDIAPHVLYVNLRQSDTYITNKFLYPLEGFLHQTLDLDLHNSQNMELDSYLEALKQSPKYEAEVGRRIPLQGWRVIRRRCPEGKDCPYAKANGGELDFEPTDRHYHIYAFPQNALIMSLFYDRGLFHEANLPDRVPKDNEEFLEFAKRLTNPRESRYGVKLNIGPVLSWSTLSFLYSAGGRIVEEDEEGNWRCVFDTEEAANAYFFVARMFHEPFKRGDEEFTGVVFTGETTGSQIYAGMWFAYIHANAFGSHDPTMIGFGPVPEGYSGERGSEFNMQMTGIFAGIEDPQVRQASWDYIRYLNGPEGRKIKAETFVQQGQGRFIQAEVLEEAGYDEYVRQIPPGWPEAYREALAKGVPEPYGKNCANVYYYASKAVSQIQTDKKIGELIAQRKYALDDGDVKTAEALEKQCKDRIREILILQNEQANQKMLSILPDDVRTKRNILATIVSVIILTVFVLLFRKVFKVFDSSTILAVGTTGKWQFVRYKWAYMLLAVPVGLVLLWQYYPLLRGTVMAFQDYNVRGFSKWVGMDNFAEALFDSEFWYSIWVTMKYASLFALFGFTAPIILALLLTEVPRGKVIFRTLFYLPAVLTGLMVIFLWRSFYGQYGMINTMINYVITAINYIPWVEISLMEKNWLNDPQLALLCILLPVVWAGMGPGCLIYLAALKTVPEEIYEAADIDGAGIWHKTTHVALPSIKALIMINFIGVMVATFKGQGEFALAMTGGGPYSPNGETEFVGLRIFYQAFGYLKFGVATAMAWIMGSMLVGFTVIQLQRLSKMEFKTATGTK